MAQETDIKRLRHVMFAMNLRIASERKPAGRGYTGLAQERGSVSLCSVDAIKVRAFLHVPIRIEVRIDRPKSAGAKGSGKPILQPVIDVHIKIEDILRYTRELRRQEVLHFDKPP